MTDDASISLHWSPDFDLWIYILFYVGTFAFFVLSGRAALTVRRMRNWVVAAGVMLLLLPSWAAIVVSAHEVFTRNSAWIAAIFVYAWIGILANVLSTLFLVVYAIRRWWRAAVAARMKDLSESGAS